MNNTPSEGRRINAGEEGRWQTHCFDGHVKTVSMGDFLYLCQKMLWRIIKDLSCETHDFYGMVKLLWSYIRDVDLGARRLCRRCREDADRARADDEHLFARLYVRVTHAVVADAERFDEGELARRESLAVVDALCGHCDVLRECTVALRTHGLVVLAAVDEAARAGIAAAAVEIGVAGDNLAYMEMILLRVSRVDLDDLRRELVPRDARIGSVGERAAVRAEVAAADAAAEHLEQCLIRLAHGFLGLEYLCLSGLIDTNAFHSENSLYGSVSNCIFSDSYTSLRRRRQSVTRLMPSFAQVSSGV